METLSFFAVIWPFCCCLWHARFSSKRHESDQLSAALDEIPRFLTSKRSGGFINTVRLSYPFCRLPFCLADNQDIAIIYHVAFCRKSQWRFLLLWSEEWLIETLSVNYLQNNNNSENNSRCSGNINWCIAEFLSKLSSSRWLIWSLVW